MGRKAIGTVRLKHKNSQIKISLPHKLSNCCRVTAKLGDYCRVTQSGWESCVLGPVGGPVGAMDIIDGAGGCEDTNIDAVGASERACAGHGHHRWDGRCTGTNIDVVLQLVLPF